MDELKNMIIRFLKGEGDPWEFSFALEDSLIRLYDQMYEVNPQATLILNNDLPDICAEYELGQDPSSFRKKSIC